MGYYTTLNGEITLSREPSIEVWFHISQLDSFYFIEEYVPSRHISFDGLDGKFYNLKNDASALINILDQVGISAGGEIVCVGEEQPDIWRLVFTGGTVVREDTKIVWPDGTEYR